jgi:hypothetical protein
MTNIADPASTIQWWAERQVGKKHIKRSEMYKILANGQYTRCANEPWRGSIPCLEGAPLPVTHKVQGAKGKDGAPLPDREVEADRVAIRRALAAAPLKAKLVFNTNRGQRRLTYQRTPEGWMLEHDSFYDD